LPLLVAWCQHCCWWQYANCCWPNDVITITTSRRWAHTDRMTERQPENRTRLDMYLHHMQPRPAATLAAIYVYSLYTQHVYIRLLLLVPAWTDIQACFGDW